MRQQGDMCAIGGQSRPSYAIPTVTRPSMVGFCFALKRSIITNAAGVLSLVAMAQLSKPPR